MIPSGTAIDPNRPHLFIVCTDPCPKYLVAIVPIATYTNNKCDQTCIVVKGDHEFVRHKSYVLYQKAQTISRVKIVNGVENGTFRQHRDLNGQTFLKVRNGMCRSPRTPDKIKKYLDCPAAPTC